MAAFADFEREIIRKRMETGRKAAEERGVIGVVDYLFYILEVGIKNYVEMWNAGNKD